VARSKRSKQLELDIRTWGGKRANAGRKRVAPRPRVPHLRRAELKRRHPVLVTIRICDGVPNLREANAWNVIVGIMCKARGRFGMHVIEYSVLGNHLHLIVEADDQESLERGMRGLNTRLGKNLNKHFQRTGRVIDGRYHARHLHTPLEVRNALRYVLRNHASHCEKVGDPPPRYRFDPRSTAPRFTGWRRPPNDPPTRDLGTSPPRTWLLRTGWKRLGLLDDADP
jgi:putative transposase